MEPPGGRSARLAARLIAADADEIALVRNTTEGISLVAEGFPWQAGDNVVTLDNEFPSNQYPWMNLASRGVETRRVPTDGGRVDLDRLAEACDRRTRIVSVSWVGYASGWRDRSGRAGRDGSRRGALLFVDAIQGLGAFPLDAHATGIDFLAADGHKWLLGPEGAGLLFVRREHLDRLRPLGVGWHSVVQHVRLQPHRAGSETDRRRATKGARPTWAAFWALPKAWNCCSAWEPRRSAGEFWKSPIWPVRRLAAAGCPIASLREGDHRSGIVLFEVPGHDPLAVVSSAAARGSGGAVPRRQAADQPPRLCRRNRHRPLDRCDRAAGRG